MCWSAEVSLNTFLFSTLPLVLCLLFKLVPWQFLLVFQTFYSMQLVEYFLWKFLKHKKWNQFFSIIGFVLIALLPLFSIYSSDHKYKLYVLFSYIIFVLFTVLTTRIKFHTSVAKNKHLSWEWLKLPLPFIFLWVLFFCYHFIVSLWRGSFDILHINIFTAGVFIFSFFSYYKSNTYGSMWCWIANFSAVYFYYLFVRKFLFSK